MSDPVQQILIVKWTSAHSRPRARGGSTTGEAADPVCGGAEERGRSPLSPPWWAKK